MRTRNFISRHSTILDCLTLAALAWALVLPFLPEHGPAPSGEPGPGRTPDRQSAASLTRIGAFPGFEENLGQADPRVRFTFRSGPDAVLLTSTQAVFCVAGAAPTKRVDGTQNTPRPSYLKMRLQGSDAGTVVEGTDRLPGSTNFLIGNDPEAWHTGVPRFAKVRYASVYPNIDLVYYHGDRGLEHDFLVHPGGRIADIRLDIQGSDSMKLEPDGNLVMTVGERTVTAIKPLSYQEDETGRTPVQSRYVLLGRKGIGFQVDGYDPSRDLVIDPVIVFSTYIGGEKSDQGAAVALDPAGNVYVAGSTYSKEFPTTTGSLKEDNTAGTSEGFVAKFDPEGLPVYITYLGGNAGADDILGIAVDASGNAHVVGDTGSDDFPTTAGAFSRTRRFGEAFVSKLNATGTGLVFSTFLGGDNRDYANAIALDAAGNAYVTGSTISGDFPTLNPIQASIGALTDCFVTKLHSSGSRLLYSTYLGGYGSDEGFGIALDSAGSIYVTGSCKSYNFPLTPGTLQTELRGGEDAFITKIRSNGTLWYSTLVGGGWGDRSYGIAVDSSGRPYIAGSTASVNFPSTTGWEPDWVELPEFFVTRISSDFSAVEYSSPMGGDGAQTAFAIALDDSNNAYVTGSSYYSSRDRDIVNFPLINPVQAGFAGESTDAFVTRISPSGATVFSTFLGGSGGLEDCGYGIAVRSENEVYVVGQTYSEDFPVVDAFQPERAETYDAFLTKLTTAPGPGEGLPPIPALLWTSRVRIDTSNNGRPDPDDESATAVREGNRLRFLSPRWRGTIESSTIELSNPHPLNGKFQTARRRKVEGTSTITLTAFIDSYDSLFRATGLTITEEKRDQGSLTQTRTGTAKLLDRNGDGICEAFSAKWPDQAAVEVDFTRHDIDEDGRPDFISIPWSLSQLSLLAIKTDDGTTDPRVFVPMGDTNGDGIPDSPAFDFDRDGLPDPDLPAGPFLGGPADPTVEHRLHFAQFADGAGLYSLIKLFNLDTEHPATTEVRITDDDGNPVSVDLNGEVVDGLWTGVIPAGGLQILATDGVGPVCTGAVTVKSDRVLGGVVIFAGPFGIAGVGNSVPQPDGFIAPMENKPADGLLTGIAIMNLETSQTLLTLRLDNQDSQTLATANALLPPLGHIANFLAEFEWSAPVDLSNFSGTLKVLCNSRVAATVLQQRQQQGEFATMPVAPFWKDPVGFRATGVINPIRDNQQYFSQFADGGGLFSQIMLMNLDSEQANVNIHLRDRNGSALAVDLNGTIANGDLSLTIPGGGLRVLKTDGQGEVQVGSVVVDSDRVLSGVILFGGAFGVAGVGGSLELNHGFVAPVEMSPRDGTATGIAMMNLGDTQTTVNLELWKPTDATAWVTAQVSIPSHGQTALYLNELPWSQVVDLSNFSGLVRATSPGRIAAVVLQSRQQQPAQYATLPVVPRLN